jgi:hypothetical protein
MSRILEFIPSDEQTVVARVLLELHQAIDINFPNANPSGRQFAKTILTSQSEATRTDNNPNSGHNRPNPLPGRSDVSGRASRDAGEAASTPAFGAKKSKSHFQFKTDEIKTLMGENQLSRRIATILWVLLGLGLATLTWLVLSGSEWWPFPNLTP